MAFKKITYAVENDIATITLNDPGTMNAAGIDTVSELLLAFEFAGDNARCTILTGNGRGFCSGANLTTVSSNSEEDDTPRGKMDAGKALDTPLQPADQGDAHASASDHHRSEWRSCWCWLFNRSNGRLRDCRRQWLLPASLPADRPRP